MMKRSRQQLCDKLITEQTIYLEGVTLSDLHIFVTKDVITPYVKRVGEAFPGITLPWRELPGFDSDHYYRVMRLDGQSSVIELVQRKNIASIDGVAQDEITTQWEVTGSKGDVYTVNNLGSGNYTCTCAQYKFRKKACKHIKEIQNGEK